MHFSFDYENSINRIRLFLLYAFIFSQNIFRLDFPHIFVDIVLYLDSTHQQGSGYGLRLNGSGFVSEGKVGSEFDPLKYLDSDPSLAKPGFSQNARIQHSVYKFNQWWGSGSLTLSSTEAFSEGGGGVPSPPGIQNWVLCIFKTPINMSNINDKSVNFVRLPV